MGGTQVRQFDFPLMIVPLKQEVGVQTKLDSKI